MVQRVVFMGSPDFALPVLRQLAESYPVIGVVTQPDRPAGRGRSLTPPPVKVLADQLGIETIQPNRLREPAAQEKLFSWNPDLIVVAAFGQILRPNVLDLPTYGCINVHASLLPRWRGAAPIQAALYHGDPVTGVSIMKMDVGIDTGAVLSTAEIPILEDDNAAVLSDRLALSGAQLLIDTLPGYLTGKLLPQPQPEEGATYAGMLKKEQGALDFSRPAQALVWQIQAYTPWPGAFFTWKENSLKVLKARVIAETPLLPVGTRSIIARQPAVAASDGWLLLEQVQPAGKKAMSGADFLRGAQDWPTLP